VRCASIILLHSATAVRGRYAKTSTQPIEHSNSKHGTIYPKTPIDQHIIETSSVASSMVSSMEMQEIMTAWKRHPEGLIAPLLRNDWETALNVILHSPHWAKRLHPMLGLPLNVAIGRGAPVEVVTALLEAYPDATTIRNLHNNVPCHWACYFGISSEGMKMLLRCNPDATAVIDNDSLKACQWYYFSDEKEQVRNDLKQLPSYWKSEEQQALLHSAFEETGRRCSMRRSVARIILGRQLDNNDLVSLVIEYL
jgi:hypothetical protein